MAKTTMTNERRKGILEWMYAQYDEKHIPALQKAAEKAIVAVNKAIRSKYPEGDMVVLRKYSSTQQDNCIRLVDSDTQQVFGVDFRVSNLFNSYTDVSLSSLDMTSLADLPKHRGCSSHDVFPISPAGHKVVSDFIKTAAANAIYQLLKKDKNIILLDGVEASDAMRKVGMPNADILIITAIGDAA